MVLLPRYPPKNRILYSRGGGNLPHFGNRCFKRNFLRLCQSWKDNTGARADGWNAWRAWKPLHPNKAERFKISCSLSCTHLFVPAYYSAVLFASLVEKKTLFYELFLPNVPENCEFASQCCSKNPCEWSCHCWTCYIRVVFHSTTAADPAQLARTPPPPPPCLILTTTSYAAKEDSWFPASTLLCKKTSSVICQSRPAMVVVHNASTGSIVLQKLLSSLVKCPWRSVASTDYFRNLCFLLS